MLIQVSRWTRFKADDADYYPALAYTQKHLKWYCYCINNT